MKPISLTRNTPHRSICTIYALAALSALPQAALAALPTVAAPTAGSGGSGLLGTLQNYSAMAAILLALILTATAFIVVGGGAVGKFNEARQRGEWGQFGAVVVIGVLLVVAIIWLANQAVTIL